MTSALVPLNALLPGAGLLLRSRPVAGAAFLVPALLCLSAGAQALVEGDDPAAWQRALAAAGLWALLAIGASVALWRSERVRPLDGALVRSLHRDAAKAFLAGDHAAATAAAERLVRAAPAEPGAWRLLELTATAAGRTRQAAGAGGRAGALEDRLR